MSVAFLPEQDEPARPSEGTDRETIRKTWKLRIPAAKNARKPYERGWRMNLAFIAGKHWMEWSRTRRALYLPKRVEERQVYDLLTQYRMTALGELSQDDDRPELLFRHEDIASEDFAKQINDALSYGWDNEWDGDQRFAELKLILIDLGTAAMRCRWDKNAGREIVDVPQGPDGQPIMDEAEARKYVAENEGVQFKTLKEGKIVWEVLSPFEILVPPRIENPDKFPWEILVTAESIETLKVRYGAKANGLKPEPISQPGSDGDDSTEHNTTDDQVFVYTCYQRPTSKFPKGHVMVLAGKEFQELDYLPQLEYIGPDGEPRSGITYFRYWPVTGRFWGRSLIDAGRGIQRSYNKRRWQIDEIIDRGLPKVFTREGDIPRPPTGRPLEIIELKKEAPAPTVDQGVAPGQWMYADLERQLKDLEQAVGIRGVSIGDNPAGVSTYSQLALLRETDQIKLNPLLNGLRRGTKEVIETTVDAIRRYWGPQKQLTIAGEDGRRRAKSFDATKVPTFYIVDVASGSSRPRSQAAQLKLVEDLAGYARTVGQPLPLKWYSDSLRAGKPEELPDAPRDDQLEKARVENFYLNQRDKPVPVPQDYDDPMVHLPEHLSGQIQAELAGDPELAQRFEQHRQMHLQMEQMKAQQQAQQEPPDGMAGAPAAPQGPPPSMPPQAEQLAPPLPG